jgi:tetratricopeptide (TPR) repeat protein
VRDLGDAYLGWGPANAAAMFATEYLLDPVAGRAWSRRALGQPRFESFGHPHDAVVDQLALAQAAMGDMDQARRTVEPLPDDAIARRVLLFLDGDWEQAAREWADALGRDEAAGDLHDAAVSGRWLAHTFAALGQTDRAIRTLHEVLKISEDGPQVPTELHARAHLARLLAASDPVVASEHLRRCEEIIAAGEDWHGLRGEIALSRGVLAAARSDEDEAQAAFEVAVDVFTMHRLPWRQADALVSWAAALTTEQAPDAAVRRAQAHVLYADLGAGEPWRQRGLNSISTGLEHR